MKIIPFPKKQFLQPRSLILIFLVLAIIMFSSAMIELHQSKNELFDLMGRQSHTLLETVLISSNNALLTYEYLELFLEERLLNNASFIRYLYEKGEITNTFLEKFAQKNNIYRINIFDSDGNKKFTNHESIHEGIVPKSSPTEILKPIFDGQQDTLVIGLKEANYEQGYRFAVAVSTKNRSAIVLNLNAENLLEFRKQIGFGNLLKQLANNPGIVYVALQDTSGIIAASDNVTELDRISQSDFLRNSLQDSLFATHITQFDEVDVFESVHPFFYEEIPIGLFRLGLSLEPLNLIKERIYRRIFIISIVLFIIGFIVVTLILIRQNYDLLHKQYQVVETYSGNIIQNVSDAIIVFNDSDGIKIFNHAAEALFHKTEEEVLGNSLLKILNQTQCEQILNSPAVLEQIECTIQNHNKILLVSKNCFEDENGAKNTILVIRDLTEQHKLEAQIQRKERLIAMGELASGVAHEIRNPLNTIGTIAQQLERDFVPQKNSEEYQQLARLVNQEVRRINDTVQDFLRFARPEPIQPTSFLLSDLIKYIDQQYKSLLAEHQVQLFTNLKWNGEVYWDRRQMQQVFMNLIQNAVDAIQQDGKIEIYVNPINNQDLEIIVQDNGPGIAEEIRSNIFNLYFTTKAKGTGIGLSIVQRVILEHGGIIAVESNKSSGTNFIIEMPIRIKGKATNE